MADYKSKHTGAAIDAGIDKANAAILTQTQSLTDDLKQIARTNIGAASQTDVDKVSEDVALLSEEIIARGGVTPQMFGAKGDGVTDDTAAFQQLDGKLAYIPEGEYRISSVVYGSNTRIIGAGMGVTTLKQTENCHDDMITFLNAQCVVCSDMTIRGCVDETDHEYLYQALVKLVNTEVYDIDGSVYERLYIKDAPVNGLVVLGARNESITDPHFYDTKYPASNYNYVHQMNNIRVWRCRRFCMIDGTSDNRYSNFYVSSGGAGCLLLSNCNSNTYVNFKIDQSDYVGVDATNAGYDDGAALLIRASRFLNLSNIDVQSAHFVGVKAYQCSGIRATGIANNCAIYDSENGTGLRIDMCDNCEFNFEFHDVNHPQKYNAIIESTCNNVAVNALVNNEAKSINRSPATCYISTGANKTAFLYDDSLSYREEYKYTNMFKNPLCESKDGWGIWGDAIEIDASGKIAGDYSFKFSGISGDVLVATQDFSGLEPGALYMFACETLIETLDDSGSTSPYPYLNAVWSGNAGANTIYNKWPKPVIGKDVCLLITPADENGYVSIRATLYNATTVVYFGNFMACKLSGNIPDGTFTQTGCENLYEYLLKNSGKVVDTIPYDVNNANVLGVVKMLNGSRPSDNDAVMEYAFKNLFQNPLCESNDGWIGNPVIDTSGKIVGNNSFKLVGEVGNVKSVKQGFNSLEPGAFYLFACEILLEELDSSGSVAPAPYVNMVYNASTGAPKIFERQMGNAKGKDICFVVTQADESGIVEFQVYLNNSTAVAYIGNFTACKLSGGLPDSMLTESGYSQIYDYFIKNIGNVVNKIPYTLKSSDTIWAINMLNETKADKTDIPGEEDPVEEAGYVLLKTITGFDGQTSSVELTDWTLDAVMVTTKCPTPFESRRFHLLVGDSANNTPIVAVCHGTSESTDIETRMTIEKHKGIWKAETLYGSHDEIPQTGGQHYPANVILDSHIKGIKYIKYHTGGNYAFPADMEMKVYGIIAK